MTRAVLVLAALSMLVAAPVRAAMLPVQATLEIAVAGSPTLGLSGTGVATVNSSGGGMQLTRVALGAGLISGSVDFTYVDPSQPAPGFRLDVANAAGTITRTVGGSLGGAIGLSGQWKSCLFSGCNTPVVNISVPLTPVGQGGSATAGMLVNVSVLGAPWTTATATAGTVTAMGFVHGPASATSTAAQPGGAVQLVTPIFISATLGASPILPSFGFLTLHFVPEPATALLLGGGIVVLVWSGRRR